MTMTSSSFQKLKPTAKTVKVKCLRTCVASGQTIHAGKLYEIPEEEAELLRTLHRVVIVEEPAPQKFVPSPADKGAASAAANAAAKEAKAAGKNAEEQNAAGKAAYDASLADAEAKAKAS